MASSFNLSMALVYFSVCFNPACPKRLATVFILAPLLRTFTAKECRAQCQVICFEIPARVVQCLYAFKHIVCDGSLNITSSIFPGTLGSPMRVSNPSFNGITTLLALLCPLVLFCSNDKNLFE